MNRPINEYAEIKILPFQAEYALEVGEIHKIVREELLKKAHESYSQAKVRVVHSDRNTPSYLIVNLYHRYTYACDVVKVSLGRGYGVSSVEWDYIEGEDDRRMFGEKEPYKSYAQGEVEMVFATPCDDIPTAVEGVNKAYDYAIRNGYTAVKLIGAQASVAAYQYWLQKDLRAFGNIGHGLASKTKPYCSGLALYDGNLMYTWFQSLPKKTFPNTVIYLNSCKAFQPDLGTSIMKAGPRTFTSGIVNLPIGPSENCFKCFWSKVLPKTTVMTMGQAMDDCSTEFIPGEMDMWGDEGKFYTGW